MTELKYFALGPESLAKNQQEVRDRHFRIRLDFQPFCEPAFLALTKRLEIEPIPAYDVSTSRCACTYDVIQDAAQQADERKTKTRQVYQCTAGA